MTSLTAYLAEFPRFDWARSNCCHFAAGWLRANGSPDPMEGLPTTVDLKAARRLVARMGGIERLCTARLGREPIPVTFAQFGDVVLFDLPDGGFTMGICNGRLTVCVESGGAFVWLPTIEGKSAWRLA